MSPDTYTPEQVAALALLEMLKDLRAEVARLRRRIVILETPAAMRAAA